MHQAYQSVIMSIYFLLIVCAVQYMSDIEVYNTQNLKWLHTFSFIRLFIIYTLEWNQAFSLVESSAQYFLSYCIVLRGWVEFLILCRGTPFADNDITHKHIIIGVQHSGAVQSYLVHSACSNWWTQHSASFSRFDQDSCNKYLCTVRSLYCICICYAKDIFSNNRVSFLNI